MPISPTSSGNFVHGVWTGNITVQQPATNAVLAANDGLGHTGQSGSFNVLYPSPIAVADAFTTPTNKPASFAAAKLAANDIAFDGGPLTVSGTSQLSAQGGGVTLASGQITYTPPLNFGGNDSFTYTITDAHGGKATGAVTATVGSGGQVSLNLVYGPVIVNGSFVVRLAGVPGLIYTLEATSDLNTPWSKVANITAPIGDQGYGVGVFQFSEPVNGNQTRFYRTVYPAY